MIRDASVARPYEPGGSGGSSDTRWIPTRGTLSTVRSLTGMLSHVPPSTIKPPTTTTGANTIGIDARAASAIGTSGVAGGERLVSDAGMIRIKRAKKRGEVIEHIAIMPAMSERLALHNLARLRSHEDREAQGAINSILWKYKAKTALDKISVPFATALIPLGILWGG